jgi:hypothetical protein
MHCDELYRSVAYLTPLDVHFWSNLAKRFLKFENDPKRDLKLAGNILGNFCHGCKVNDNTDFNDFKY